MDWLKKNWTMLMPFITLLAGITGGALGVKITIAQGPVAQPEINITLPMADGTTTKIPVKYATATTTEKK